MKSIFYASSTGNTEQVAKTIKKNLEGFELVDIASSGISKMNECDSIIIGASTWGEGDLQDDWEDCFEELKEMDFSGKTVALFGLGDQDNYYDEFVNALGTLYEVVKNNGANIIGFTSTDGYEFEESTAVVDSQFVGLVIDEDNQSELTKQRVEDWCNQISNKL
ncbi:flavodoxin [Halarcobacter ebronensis]|uniref:Flavodoxin n=1 Tax=Halarcobacter ebronensis TaxID=1462615 RepID=A0A4Q1AQJ6_9BACT|nr:flavodoxin [Halarcobacter ebronensis]QKF81276.1 flavodoxin [Halarcobacter ebronensis]RXK04842.1 flavodoxin [Halarcobacter ebronensis]